MNVDEMRACNEWVVQAIGLIVDSDESLLNRVNAVAVTAVVDFAPGEPGVQQIDAYAKSLKDEGSHGYQGMDYARSVGEAVADDLHELVTESTPDTWIRMLLLDLLDLTSSGMHDVLGEHFMPSLDDVTAEIGEDDDDDDDTGDDDGLWEEHTNDIGDWCPFSGKVRDADDTRCPQGCAASDTSDDTDDDDTEHNADDSCMKIGFNEPIRINGELVVASQVSQGDTIVSLGRTYIVNVESRHGGFVHLDTTQIGS